jgi:hypothetical protein
MIETPLNEVSSNQSKKRTTDLRTAMIQHLESYAVENSLELRNLIKDISKKQNISLRGLEKILSAQVTTPSVETQIKVYSYLYNSDSIVELLTKVPESVANNIQSSYTGSKTQNTQEVIKLTKDNLFNSIYLLSSGDVGISLSFIKEEFGRQGLIMVEKMINLELVALNQDEFIIRKNSILMGPQIRKNIIGYIVDTLYKPEKNQNVGQNYSGLVLGDIPEEDYALYYREIKDFISSMRERITNSKATKSNFKKIAIAMVMDEYNCSNSSSENELC